MSDFYRYSPGVDAELHKEYSPRPLRDVYKSLEKVTETITSVVYCGKHKETEKKVAIKFLKTGRQVDDAPVRWLREIDLLKHKLVSICSPFLLGVEDLVHDDELGFGIVSPWVEYGTLENEIETFPADGQMIASVGMQITLGLNELHKNGIVHRDLKPENIFVDRQGKKKKFKECKVGDFGSAVTLEYLKKPKYRDMNDWATAESVPSIVDLWDDRLTPFSRTVGTPTYMSPEQALGKPLDARTDLFSLGSILFEMIAHKTPFYGSDAPDIMRNLVDMRFHFHASEKFKNTKLSFLSPVQEIKLKDIIHSLLVKDVSQRGKRLQGAQMHTVADVARAIAELWDGNNSAPITQTREFQMARAL